MNLRRRVRSMRVALDEAEIARLTARYFYAVDHGDVDAYVDTFAEGATVEYRGRVVTGREGLGSLVTGASRAHVLGSSHVTVSGTEAKQYCTVLLCPRGDGSTRSGVEVAYYTDDLEKTGESWKFRRRRIES